jgi:transcriptional regulator with XRE-family HTH domain
MDFFTFGNNSWYNQLMIQELLEQLRAKGWSDEDIGDALGVSRITVYRWRRGQRNIERARPVIAALRQLLRRRGPPRRKGEAGISPATPVLPAMRRDLIAGSSL